jgi:hypothetical protein
VTVRIERESAARWRVRIGSWWAMRLRKVRTVRTDGTVY